MCFPLSNFQARGKKGKEKINIAFVIFVFCMFLNDIPCKKKCLTEPTGERHLPYKCNLPVLSTALLHQNSYNALHEKCRTSGIDRCAIILLATIERGGIVRPDTAGSLREELLHYRSLESQQLSSLAQQHTNSAVLSKVIPTEVH